MMLVLAAPGAALALPSAALGQPAEIARSGEKPSISIVVIPRGTTPAALGAESDQLSVGIMSAGLGTVPAQQTYLDIGQGNRVFGSLYPDPLPPLSVLGFGVPAVAWEAELERAAGAPAQIDPGLLGGELSAAGVPVGTLPGAGSAGLLAVKPDGSIERRRGCRLVECPGLTVVQADGSSLAGLVGRLEGDDLLIAIEEPPPVGRRLAIGIAGRGFGGGNLSSPTTRIDGYVLSTDVAPTILERLGLAVPGPVSGRAISADSERDLDALVALGDRMGEVGPRRHPVLGVNVMIWFALTLLAALAFGRRGSAVAISTLAVTFAWVPAILLLTAALEPSLLVERLAVGLGGPLLAWASIRGFRARCGERAAFAAFALAAAASVLSTAIDVVAGSPLTSLSLLGPNPELGVRFFGIGNELEAVIGALLALGSGAAVVAARPANPRRAVAITAAATAFAGVVVFAPGRFGADVGAAITFPAGAAGVVIAALGGSRRRVLLIAAVPVAAVAALVAVDLAIGGDAHLSRSVLDAGGLEELGQVVERRVRLGARSFERFFDSLFYAGALLMMVAAFFARDQILAWFSGLPAGRAGLIGGVSAAVVGALANDSGALLLMVGTAYVAGFAGLAWATRDP